jgi:hypothetical protein
LANDEETRKIFLEKGGVKIMAELLESDNRELVRCSIGAFGTFAMNRKFFFFQQNS